MTFFSNRSDAVPYFALLAETQCSHCHVNPTGGGMRSDHGNMILSEFSLEKTRDLIDPQFRGRLNKYFGIGGDIRLQHLSTIQAEPSNSFTIPWGTLYLSATPFRHLTLYTDTDLANVTNREAFGLIHDLPQESWIKFGRFNLPYGLRLPDDTAFIRADLGFTFAAQDLGVELGIEPGPFTFAAAFVNGVGGGAADDNQRKAVSWFSEWRGKLIRFGTSFFYNDASATQALSGGGHTGFHFGKMVLLGEFDYQRVRTIALDTSRNVFAGYGEVDYQLIPGLFLKGTYDGIDDNLGGSGLHHRISSGIEFFPIPHLEVDLLYRYRIGSGNLGDDQILALLHGFF